MIENILLIIIGMVLSLLFLMLGYKLGQGVGKDEETISTEGSDDFPKTLDGKFYSREAAINSISLKEGD